MACKLSFIFYPFKQKKQQVRSTLVFPSLKDILLHVTWNEIKPRVRFWRGGGIQSRGVSHLQAARVSDLQILEDAYNIFYRTVRYLQYEYFTTNIVEVLASLLLWLLNSLDKLL